MPDFEHFSHFFGAMFHVNVAAIGFITFFYKHIHRNIQNKINALHDKIKHVELSLNEDFKQAIGSVVSGPVTFKSILSIIHISVRAFFHLIFNNFITKPIFYISKKRLGKINNERDYIKRYFPLFLVVGIYCLLMLLLSETVSEFEFQKQNGIYFNNWKHISEILIIGSWIFVGTYTGLNILMNSIISKSHKILLFNFAILIIALILPIVVFSKANYHIFHNITQSKKRYSFLIFSVIYITIFPTFNLARKYLAYKFAVLLAEVNYAITQKNNSDGFDNSLGD